MKRSRRKQWTACPSCHMLIFAEVNTLGNHQCHPKIQAKVDAQLDNVIDEVMSTWDMDLKLFWRSKDVKFTQYLLKKDLYDNS